MSRSKLGLLTGIIAVAFAALTRDAAAVTMITSCQGLNSGSYILANDIVASGNCFVLNGDNVTINFAGQTVTGNGTGTAISIVPQIFIQHINIIRGTITGFANGIDFSNTAENSAAIFVQIQSMRLYGCSGFGIRVANSAIVGDNIVHTDGAGIISVGCFNSFIQNLSEGNPLGNKVSNCSDKIDNLGF